MIRKFVLVSAILALLFCAPVVAQDEASISGLVWMDSNRNGVFDAGESVISAVAVDLVRTSFVGTPIISTATGDDGVYQFQYDPTIDGNESVFVRFTLPIGPPELEFTTQNVGDPATDSDANARGETRVFMLEDGDVRRNIDAGMREVEATDPTDPGTGDAGTDTGADTGTDTTTGTANANLNLIGGTIPAGVEVDAAGVLRLRTVDRTGALSRQRAKQLRALMDPVLVRPSSSRMVSLNRLEAAVADSIKTKGFISDELAFLAGITRVKHVFLFPESGDIVISGPAEGFTPDEFGRMVGIKSRQSTLQLQDLIVALRSFMPGEQPTPIIGCSIDPTEEGLERMQQFLQSIAGRVVPSDDVRIAQGLAQSLGPQTITVQGVPANTHFAQVLIEADYRMKLIGIGLEQPPVSITTYIQRASPSSVARNALQRWYFVPDYESVRVSDDGLAMELVGEGVKLVGADERVQRDGQRVRSGRSDRASKAFVRSFTQRYPALARKEPVFGQLRNLIDLSIVAAYLQQEDVYGQLGWEMRFFGDESIIPVEVLRSPKTVEPAVNVVWKGNTLMTPIGGGVSIETAKALASNRVLSDEDGMLEEARDQVAVPQLADGQWWWD